MFNRISVLVPTRLRPDRLRVMISSFDASTGNRPDAELVFRVDDDDIATRDFLFAWGGHKIVVGPRLEGYRSMPTFFNEMAAAATGDVLMCGNDDMVFRTAGWPKRILDEANKYPDGVFNFGVSTFNETHYPFSIVSRKAVDRLGFLWDPRIFWGDLYLRDVMSAFGRSIMLRDVQIDHDWMGFHPDPLFTESDKSISADYWNSVHAPAVSEAVDRLRSLSS